MTRYATSQEWLHQSSLLLEARPSTTKITTRYSIKPARPAKSKKSDDPNPSDSAASRPPRAKLTLRTYDPVSGVALVYRTTKAAEVSRLVQMLGTLGRRMAGLPDLPPAAEEVAMADAPPASGAATPTGGAAPGGQAPAPAQQQQQQGGGGGKGKKKKGKR
ncbi:hypothetical protein NKR23_g2808 [Pleurostoma richardsiae]|uniref:SRP9 domain-containing protein n=1 Tax=Pleurostoma richardsiae TaxID=41990 RepID=A0AA38RPM8_9PEZI|nr:hypothetical protein NKR23_g2808 [Pleurostoma richardsiae]